MDIGLNWRRQQSEVWPDVSYALRPLKVWAFQELVSLWSSSDEHANFNQVTKNLAVISAAGRVFSEHVRNLEGLHIIDEHNSREAISIEALTTEALCAPLAAEIIERLISISNLGDEEEKNSAGQSDAGA